MTSLPISVSSSSPFPGMQDACVLARDIEPTKDTPITPFHRLPTELIAIIFVLASSSTSNYWDQLVCHYSCMRVCRHWHQIAHSAPLLWRTIKVLTNLELKGIADPVVRLEKSGKCSIQIILQETIGSGGTQIPSFGRVIAAGLSQSSISFIQLLPCHSSHTSSLEIECISPAIPHKYYDKNHKTIMSLLPLQGSYPLLTKLSICWLGDPDLLAKSQFSAPLKVLKIQCHSISPEPFLHVASEALETLHISTLRMVAPETLGFITRCTQLRYLRLSASLGLGWGDIPTSGPSTIHTSLETIILDGEYVEYLSRWNAPSLKLVEIDDTIPNLPPFLFAFPSLTDLRLTRGGALPVNFDNLLIAAPSLRRIYVNDEPNVLGSLTAALGAYPPLGLEPALLSGRLPAVNLPERSASTRKPILCPDLEELTVQIHETTASEALKYLAPAKELIGNREHVIFIFSLDTCSAGVKELVRGTAVKHPGRIVWHVLG